MLDDAIRRMHARIASELTPYLRDYEVHDNPIGTSLSARRAAALAGGVRQS